MANISPPTTLPGPWSGVNSLRLGRASLLALADLREAFLKSKIASKWDLIWINMDKRNNYNN